MKFIIIGLLYSVNAFSQITVEQRPTEKKIKINQDILYDDPKSIDTLFKNMIVVQKKAFERKGKFVFDSHLSFDFSDNPKTMYGASLGVGYAFAESFEFGLSYSPFILSSERSTVKAVRKLTLEDGSRADLIAPDAKSEMGLNLTWAFAYGKDAFGPYSIIRSDTFLKLFATKIQYSEGLDGNRIGMMLGKTFFVSKNFNFRFAAGFARQTSYVNLKSQSTNIGLIEPGLVWFL